MKFSDFFTTIPTMSANNTKRLLEERGVESINLIDVRQPKEYAEHHLPGAKLIPLGELSARINEIDPDKPVITY